MSQADRAVATLQQSSPLPIMVWHFVRHFLEMCASMCIGIIALGVVYNWAMGLVGVSNPYVRFPEFSALMLAFNMTLPMVAWMRIRGMAWRPIIEMAAAMVVEAFAIVVLYWMGLLANEAVGNQSTLWLWQHGLMMPAMLVPMLLRLHVYTGGMHHGAHAP